HTSPTSRAARQPPRTSRDARTFREAALPGKRRPSSVLPFPAGEPRLDLLEQPGIAIRIAERGVGLVGASLRIRSRNGSPIEVEHPADLSGRADLADRPIWPPVDLCVRQLGGSEQLDYAIPRSPSRVSGNAAPTRCATRSRRRLWPPGSRRSSSRGSWAHR